MSTVTSEWGGQGSNTIIHTRHRNYVCGTEYGTRNLLQINKKGEFHYSKFQRLGLGLHFSFDPHRRLPENLISNAKEKKVK